MQPMFSKHNQPRWDASMEQWYPPDPAEDESPSPKYQDPINTPPGGWYENREPITDPEQDLPF